MSASAGRHLLQVEMDTYQGVVTELQNRGLVPGAGLPSDLLAEFGDAVRLSLLGGETVRVKVWSPQGVILYSDAGELIGQSFRLSGATALATGEPRIDMSDPGDPENLPETGREDMIEFYVPVLDANGNVLVLFEIYRRAELVEREAREYRAGVWLMIGTGLGTLAVFAGSLAIATVHALSRRRRQAEGLLGELLTAQDQERTQIVGALHDDIGQPLYRVLFGLQGARAHLAEGHPVAAELARSEELLRHVEASLRSELRLLDYDSAADIGLRAALEELAAATRAETGLRLELYVGPLDPEPGPVASSALFRAAREAVTNARKHAKAEAVQISVRVDSVGLALEVQDDGVGIGRPLGLGLTSTRERLEAIGGGLTIETRRGRGTILRAWVPLLEEPAQ